MALLLLKLILVLCSIGLGLWNYLWRDTINLPFLSEISSTIVYVIAAGILLLSIIINFATRNKY